MGNKKGICTLCGKGLKLSFEHVPPVAAGNQPGVVAFGLLEWLDHVDRGQPLEGRPQPKGTGSLALCEKCNRFLGVNYVPRFTEFAMAGVAMLGQVADRLQKYDSHPQPTVLEARFVAIDRLAVAKQIVAMLLVVAGRGPVEANPELARFVLEPERIGLGARHRLFLALNPGPMARFAGVTASLNLDTHEIRAFCELAYPPFAYALSLNNTAIYAAGEITDWASSPPNERSEVQLRLQVGFSHTGVPGDLRTYAQVQANLQRNQDVKP